MTNRVRELVEKRTIDSKHFLRDDGKIEAEIFSYPIHYKNENGEFEDVDLSIIPNRQWETEYAVKKNNYRAYFNDSSSIENYTLAIFEVENKNGSTRWINYKLFGATPTGHSYIENTFKYENVFDGVDLEYVVDHKKLKERIILKKPVDNFSFTFSLKMSDGLTMQEQNNGAIYFLDDDTGEILWIIQSPYAYDAEYDGSNEIVYDNEGNIVKVFKTKNVSYSFGKVTYNGVEYDSITVTLEDDEFLSKAVYPIVIDPTTTLNISQDSCTYFKHYYYPPNLGEPYYNDSNYGSDTAMAVGTFVYNANPPYYYELVIYQSWIKYSSPTLPSGAIIRDVALHLYTEDCNTDVAPYLKFKQVTSNWYESTITSRNRPSTSSVELEAEAISYPASGNSGWCIYRLPAEVLNYSYGLHIYTYISTNYIQHIAFVTSEGATAYRPKIVVTYEIPNKNPTASLVSFNGSSSNPTITTDTTPTLRWSFSDPDGDSQSTYRVYVYEYPADTLVYDSGTVSSTATSKTVPEGVLEYRKTYRWRVYVTDGRGGGAYSTYGYFYIEIPSIGTAKIRINGVDIEFPIYNPDESVMTGKNQLRCNIGGVVGCFELVDVTDPKASVVRIKTASGVKAIRLQ